MNLIIYKLSIDNTISNISEHLTLEWSSNLINKPL